MGAGSQNPQCSVRRPAGIQFAPTFMHFLGFINALLVIVMRRIAIVTGSNKGIGLEIARGLARNQSTDVVILACRNRDLGVQCELNLKREGLNVDFIQLDLSSEESIVSFVDAVGKKYGRVDSLCNNGAIAFKAADPTPFSEQVEPTFRTNYYGTVSLTMKLLPMMKKSIGARIVNVASMAGRLQLLAKKNFLKQIKDGMFSVSDVDDLICKPFIDSVNRHEHEKEGWPSTCYGMSKLALIAFTKALARAEPEIQVYSCCPGWVKTEMSSNRGSKTPEQGAATPLLLLTEPPGLQCSGEFWQEEKAIEW